jgi:hypothetical protein
MGNSGSEGAGGHSPLPRFPRPVSAVCTQVKPYWTSGEQASPTGPEPDLARHPRPASGDLASSLPAATPMQAPPGQ